MLDYKLFNKDCRRMVELPDESVHVACTSPPYWGLRKYSGEQALIWGGDENCQHEWDIKKISLLHENRNFHAGTQEEVMNSDYELAHTHKTSNLQAGFCSLCGAWHGAYGLEPTPEMYIQHSVEILREIRRVLRSDGVAFWNIGDSYCGYTGDNYMKNLETSQLQSKSTVPKSHLIGTPQTSGLKPLDLCLIPERLAIALQGDGWWVRSIIIWHKPNPMPESVNGWRWERHRIHLKARARGSREGATPSVEHHPGQVPHRDGSFSESTDSEWEDCPGCPKCSPNDGLVLRKGSWRPTDSYEQILMLAKTASYYCDAEAVREAYTEPMNRWGGETLKRDTSKTAEYKEMQNIGYSSAFRVGRPMRPNENGRNLRNVWSFPAVPYPGAHFAVFPEKLPELCIKAATPEVGVCAKCGAPWARVIERTGHVNSREIARVPNNTPTKTDSTGWSPVAMATNRWRPTCSCNCPDKVPATVLDPFAGAGTTLLSAIKLGRNAVGFELSTDYCAMIRKRINDVQIKLS